VKQIIDDMKPKLIVAGPEFKATGSASGVPTVKHRPLRQSGRAGGAKLTAHCAYWLERAQCRAMPAKETSDDDEAHEAVTCLACQRVHLVNPATGRVIGEGN
jgi:hypothetical protein